jgi:hypothetical protein
VESWWVRELRGLSTSTVSKHLSILRDADLIVDAKDGKWIIYKLNDRTEGNLGRGLLDLLKVSFKEDEQVRSDRKKLQMIDRESICGMYHRSYPWPQSQSTCLSSIAILRFGSSLP